MGSPNWSQFIEQAWGGAYANLCGLGYAGVASGIVVGSNPPYSVADFLAVYPQFGGVPIQVAADILTTSYAVANLTSVAGLAPGQLITGPDLFDQTTIATVGPGTALTFSAYPLANVLQEAMTVYPAPFVPLVVLQMFVTLASASVNQGMYFESWPLAMAFFIAHYATMYLRTNGNPTTTAQQAAASGAIMGFVTSESVGDVSFAQQDIWLEISAWGAFALTSYGQQFVTLAKTVGFPAMWVTG